MEILLAAADLSTSQWVALVGLAAILVSSIVYTLTDVRMKRIMPPGPKGLPFVGNALQISGFQWLQFTEWTKKYGPIFTLHVLGQRIVVLNSFSTAADLLSRRSHIYSRRPQFIMGQIITGGLLLPLLNDGDRLRRMQRALRAGFGSQSASHYQNLLGRRAAILVNDVLRGVNQHDQVFDRFCASTLMGAVYGMGPNEHALESALEPLERFASYITAALLPGAYLVEFLPIMLYLPSWMANWKRAGLNAFHDADMLFETLFNDVEKQLERGSAQQCLATSLLQTREKSELSRQEAAWLAGCMLGAGSETISAMLSVFVLAMILNPEVQRRAQQQVDAVIGRERMPTTADRDELPFVQALVMELFRWLSDDPIGVPRQSSDDDWYNGYFMPKGTTIILNVWAMHQDPQYFPDSDEFRPERYLDTQGNLADPIPDTHRLGHMSFGTGNRMCPGKDLAKETIFIVVATFLWALNIEPAFDIDGQPIMPSRTELVDKGIVVRPKPFQCRFTPRFPGMVAVVQAHGDIAPV